MNKNRKKPFNVSGSSPNQEGADFLVENHGSIFLLIPLSDSAQAWVDEHIGSENGFQPYWPTVVIEHRFADAILAGIAKAELVVSR